MSLKFEVDSLDGLDEGIAGLYEQHGDKFRLKVEGIDPADELKEALRKEREERKAAKERAETLEREARERAEEAARKAGDTEALEKSWQDKLAKREAELAEALKSRDAQLMDLTVGQTAARMAGELAVPGSADVLLPHIKARLRYEDGKTIVTDADGKPSAYTVEELANEIRNDKRFAPLIVASRADGGGATGSRGGGAAKTWDQLSGMERVELRRSNPAEHARLKKAHEAANKR